MIYAEILAGGKGTRMGNTALPKQFLELGGVPIIIHTIGKFVLEDRFEKILIVVLPEWVQYAQDLINKHFDSDTKNRLVIVEGGQDRNSTLMNGVNYIDENYGLNEDDIIVTHDAVRPFVSRRIISENIENALLYGATDTAIAATDTIIKTDKNYSYINEIPERDVMFQGQTPQSFNIKKLKSAYDNLTNDQKKILTDAAKIMLLASDNKVKVVNGDQLNFKITRSYDLKVANLLIEEG